MYLREAILAVEKYRKANEEFLSNLTPEQCEAKLKVEDKLNKSKKKLAALERQLEKPRRPGSSYTFFIKENFRGPVNVSVLQVHYTPL